MILLCGGTGLLGSSIARRLAERTPGFRALVRPGTDASQLERLGAEIVRGDLRDAAALPPAVAGVQTVISTANAMSRVLGGKTDLTLRNVDDLGNANLVRAAEQAGVERFVFLSFPGAILAASTPFSDAKLATEHRLQQSSMHEVMGQALRADLVVTPPSDAPLRVLGVEPRPVSAYISQVVAGAGGRS
jgi:uncharacterized protein YbjT (DUF2867 family)